MIGKNNPLNIRAAKSFKWLGQTGSTRGFCNFQSLEFCYRAGAYLLMISYPRRMKLTISNIVTAWAPPIENPTQTYIKFVAKYSNIDADKVITQKHEIAMILAAMNIFEQGYHFDDMDGFYKSLYNDYIKVIDDYKLSILSNN